MSDAIRRQLRQRLESLRLAGVEYLPRCDAAAIEMPRQEEPKAPVTAVPAPTEGGNGYGANRRPAGCERFRHGGIRRTGFGQVGRAARLAANRTTGNTGASLLPMLDETRTPLNRDVSAVIRC